MGTDSAGRAQYIYHTKHHAKQAAAKFDRITSFGANLPKLRQQVEKDLSHREFDKQKVLACAVSLMDEVYFRVGNHKYASEHQSYGLTTLRSKHVSVDGHTVMFDFVGKSGQQQHKEITDRQLATIIKTLDEMPGYEIFRYYDNEGNIKDLTSADVNEYIKGIMGDDYSAKDFRTWGGTLLACIELANLPRPRKKTERTKAITECVQKVAERLGNTPAIARSSYIDPRIFKMFESSDQLAKVYQTVKTIKKSNYLSSDEQCVVKILSV
jgi:DNA topoisomerase-1